MPFLVAGALSRPLSAATAGPGESAEDLAKQLANPVAALISVPFQLNYDGNIGPADEGERWLLNFQPMVPISLNGGWNLISLTIVPLIDQQNIFPGAGNQSGIGDIVQSLFFSPVKPTAGGWILGAGPVFLLPTGSDDLLTTDKWAAGPTAVALRQQGPWTYGALANHRCRSQATPLAATSTRPSCNPSCPARRRPPGPSLSTLRVPTTGTPTNGPPRSTGWLPR